MNFKYVWKKLSEDGLFKEVRDTSNDQLFREYDTEEEAVNDVRYQLTFNQYIIPSDLVLIKVLNISWEDRE